MARRGMMMVEVAVAGALAGTLLILCLQLLSAALAQRHAADQRQGALMELGNVMEQITARPWAQLTTARLSRDTLSPSANRQLPDAELKIDVSTSGGQPDAKRITVAIRWRDRSGQFMAPVTLTTWKYKILD